MTIMVILHNFNKLENKLMQGITNKRKNVGDYELYYQIGFLRQTIIVLL